MVPVFASKRCGSLKMLYFLPPQTQQLQMQPMSRPDVNPGVTETQQMRITAPVGVSMSSVTQPIPSSLFNLYRLSDMSYKIYALLTLFPRVGQYPTTSASIILDRWTADPRPGGLFWVSPRSHGIKVALSALPCFTLFLSFFPPCLSCCRNPIVDRRPLAKK